MTPGAPAPPDPGEPPGALDVLVRTGRLTYGDRVLFDGLTFPLRAGKWTCLLGPSGVGKSTLLRLIAGLLPGSDDSLVTCADGRPLTGRIAYMAQEDLLLPWLDVLGNVTFGHRLRRAKLTSALRDRALLLLERVGLGDRLSDRPDTLSGGMRQRVALVRTLLEDRPLVLMDEPFSALDAITRVRLQDLFAELLRGRTVLLVTHDPLEALRLGHRIHVLAGSPARLGEPLEPPGQPPRDLLDPEVLRLQGVLLARLSRASGDKR